jgi:NAD(P)-dependent dehydrogenase (short-subunit alcohol dehydrogenase family)
MKAATHSKLRVLVTGGAAGIGSATARSFLLRGAEVVICDADGAALQRTIREEPDLIGCVTDISVAEAVDVLFETIESRLGGLDVLVNNAGISGPTGPVEEIGVAEWEQTLAVNANGQFFCTRRAVPLLKKAGGGSIINISSAAGKFGFSLRTPYAASKWAVIGFTKSLAMELGPFAIRVNAILPGIVAGARIKRVAAAKAAALQITQEEMEQRMVENVSMRCMVTADDIANLILFLCSEAGRRISGQSLSVDGNLEVLR